MQRLSVLLFVLLFSALFCFSQSTKTELKKVGWTSSEKDFNLDIKDAKIGEGNHKIEIRRQAANETENLLIKKAEALYPTDPADENNNSWPATRAAGENDLSQKVEDAPFWSAGTLDGARAAKFISSRAIEYYQELSAAFRDNQITTRIKVMRTRFDYAANVVHYDKYEINGETFENVSVVFMKMNYSLRCEGDCGMGFNREKIVVFDKTDEPVALYIDLYPSYRQS